MPIGIASAIGQTEGHRAIWTWRVHGADLPRRSVISDRPIFDPRGVCVLNAFAWNFRAFLN